MSSSFGLLHPKVRNLLEKRGFKQETDPQRLSIPAILAGKNVLIIARTGSGKTESSILPIFSRIVDVKKEGIKALYIAPLRALNRDLMERMEWWGDQLDIKISVRHGDTTQHERRKQALSPPDILITTPETLQAMLTGKVLRENLRSVKVVVVDEIHELAADKRGTQLSVGLERLGYLSGGFQRIGLSATVGYPQEIARFLVNDRPIEIIDASSQKVFDIGVEYPIPEDEDEDLATDLSTTPQTARRVRRIKELVEENKSVLTFVNTRETAEALSSRFNIISDDIDIHHSSLSKKVRIDTEKKFKAQDIKCIICTSSMELGIDVGSVSLVVQYMSPRQTSRLIQRVGRSGHKHDEVPRGIIITTDADDILESIVIARRAGKNMLERIEPYEKPFDVLAHQIIGISMDMGDVGKRLAYDIIRGSYPYRDLTWEEYEGVLKLLSSLRLIWLEEDMYHKSRNALGYYFDNQSVIPDVKKFLVVEIGTNRTIGVLDEEFVVDRANIGMGFIIKGRAWNVIDVSEDTVLVEEVNNMAATPAWEGELIPVPFDIAQEVFTVRKEISESLYSNAFRDSFVGRYSLDDNAFEELQRYVGSQQDYVIPEAGKLYIEIIPNLAIFHLGLGSVANETLGRALAALYSNKFGTSVAMKSDAYRIAFRFPSNVSTEDITEVLSSLRAEDVRPILELSLKRTSMFLWKFTHVATRMGVLSKDVEKFRIKGIMASYQDTPVFQETYKELFKDKLDVSMVEEYLRSLQEKVITIIVQERKNPSPFSGSLLAKFGYGELVGPLRPEKEILKLFKKRLEDRRVRLFCVTCGRWHASIKISNMDEVPRCPLCGARFLAIIDKKEKLTRKALLKRMKKEKISNEEEELVIRAKRTADLILVYGKKAVVAFSARGVGAQTAARVLAKMQPDEESFLRDLLEAEKTYARTRRFWD
ncbi:MAG: DEAD/DEAH box helicase [Candidatus Methanofastidiosa archaeon]|nr:DEAD/DEAH box helicase [Candidatus Methanofastidiosa archaeon]